MKIKFILLLLILPLVGLQAQAKPIKVMLLTGQTDKYHRWKVTSAYLKAILDHQKIFETDEVLIPEGPGKEFDDFVPDFSNYQVVVMNLDLPEWNKKAKTAFVDYVKNGGGVVLVHEADNAFVNWKEFGLIEGLGGWGGQNAYPKWKEFFQHSKLNWNGRNERNGPYYYWKDGKYVTDNSPGFGGKHGKRVPYVVNVRDTKHPITRGLPTKWLHPNDELYGNLRGPAKNIHVLATAFSEKALGGTGKEEPVLFTVTYGKGRIFQTVMGHTGNDFSDSVEDVGFQVTFSRGVEWAATGKVTQKPPKEFPTETKVLLRTLDKLK